MGTKKGQTRKTARRAYEGKGPRKTKAKNPMARAMIKERSLLSVRSDPFQMAFSNKYLTRFLNIRRKE